MQKSLPVVDQPIIGEINLSGSKSLANRVLLIAACAKGVSVIDNVPANKDVLAGINALESLGVAFAYDPQVRRIKIEGCGGVFPNKKASIFCDEAGTLTRFILPLCAVQMTGEYFIDAAKRMRQRPIKELLDVLTDLGMKAMYHERTDQLPMTIKSCGLAGESVTISGDKSSQFLSGLLLASPLIKKPLLIQSKTDHPQPYVKMTLQLMRDFGVDVTIKQAGYTIEKDQCYQSRDYVIEPDISTASYFWAAAAITQGQVKVKNVSKKAIQGDIRFLDVLAQMGCDVIEESGGITVIGHSSLQGVNINMRNFSDTFMTVAAIACFAQTPTHLTGLAHTKGQESDRILAMYEGLSKLGVYAKIDEDSIYIDPKKSKLRSATVQSYNDHRIAMSLALIGLKQDGVVIDGAQSVSKTCPDYFERMNKMIQQTVI
ncbi:3-phosphoshikimate 1-carboxyvinyltransferase [Facilibium subflavum]|uniref:3-phosphoshikimate 1-carboxyvinyltransferase n=1 Tax=Facilibium subflavum TaxID=2219058 RepID=UPI000E6487EF|nr:3-phosphoshikimate 1-carboxyvinyltransferase [Facilibium subflavum]